MSLTITITFEEVVAIDPETLNDIVNSFIKEPPVSTEPIASTYNVYFEETQFFSFSFVDALASKDEFDESEISGLQIRVASNNIAEAVEIS